MDNISFETVIIVACICGTVIAVLSLVLVILCCKRCRAKRMFEKMNRLNDQLSMNPLNGPSVIASSSEDQSLRQRAESRNSRVMEEVVSPHVVDRNGATYQVQGIISISLGLEVRSTEIRTCTRPCSPSTKDLGKFFMKS